jgi:hypothetical protein
VQQEKRIFFTNKLGKLSRMQTTSSVLFTFKDAEIAANFGDFVEEMIQITSRKTSN